MTDVSVVVGPAGAQPTPPAQLLAQLIALVQATNPGYTGNLPGSLIEDIASTDVGALVLSDSFRVELINSLTPFGSNPFLTNQLGQIYGVQQGADTNTSVFVVFTGSGLAGYVIPVGFTVSDGTHQYTVQDGGIIQTSNSTAPLFCLATTPGTWVVLPNTVTQIITSLPGGVTITATNPLSGTPGGAAQTAEDYRAQVLQAGLASSQGMPRYLKTLLGNVVGVQQRLISVLQDSGGGWEIICGGGDPYAVAYAIFTAIFDVSTLTGSVLRITGITQANPGVVTTDLNHGFTSGQVIGISGVVGMTAVNGTTPTITVITEKTFSIGVDTTSFGSYVSGGVVTPSLRNVSVTVSDYPNTYTIPFVNPPQQTVAIALVWNTSSPNFVSGAAVAQLGAPALVTYVNSIPVGQPMNLFELQAVFQISIAGILAPQLLTRMVFTVDINGVAVSPTSGTGIIPGDPSSFFFTTAAQISITQG